MSTSPSRAAIDPQVIAAGSSPAAHSGKPASKAKPASKSKAPSSKATKPAASSKKPSSASKKPTSSGTQKVTAPKKPISKPAAAESKLSMEEMIKDAIKNDKENVRGGVSRPAIKKYLAFRFKILDTPTNVTRLNKAISRGAEKGIFALPKGASGKVKLGKSIAESKPVSATKTAKPARKSSGVVKAPSSKPSVAAKKAAATKKSPAAKKVPVKKVSTSSTKKTAPAKKPVGKKTSSTTKKVKAAAK